MATTRKLVLTFVNSEGSTMSLSWNYAASSIDASKVKALVNGIITNGSIFAKTPVSAKAAKVVKTEDEEIDITQ